MTLTISNGRQRCSHQSQSLVSTSSTYPNDKTILSRPDYCIIMTKLQMYVPMMYTSNLYNAVPSHLNDRICERPDKRKLLEKYYARYPNLCIDVTKYLHKRKVCNSTLPDTEIISDKMNNLITEYASNNIAVVKIFIKDPYYTSFKKDEAMTWVSFVGTCGGLAGLSIGLSFVSLFEILYHVMNCSATRFQQMLNENNPKQ
jgi:hypothetical protein